jgi:hypothetical protein
LVFEKQTVGQAFAAGATEQMNPQRREGGLALIQLSHQGFVVRKRLVKLAPEARLEWSRDFEL